LIGEFSDSGDTASNWDLGINGNGTPRMTLRGASKIDANVSAINLHDGKWHHVVAVNTPTSIQQYVDGILISTTNGTWTANTNALPLIIGAREPPPGVNASYFTGSIDDVRIYNRTLSSAEIAQLYGEGGGKINASGQTLQNGTGLDSGLAAYWSFNGADVTDKVYDRAGGNNGYTDGSVATSTMKTQGKLGQALNFNGNTNYVSVPLTYNWNANDWTVSVWASTTGCLNSFCGLVGNRFGAGAANWVTIGTDGDLSGRIAVEMGPSGATIDTGYDPANKGWQYYTVTKSGTTISIYRNGVFVTSGSSSGKNLGSTTNNVRIGNWVVSNQIWKGPIDEVRIYSRALSAAEVKSLYNLGR
jgi:hypothetical protein